MFVFPGNIETNHNLPPSYVSRNNLLRYVFSSFATFHLQHWCTAVRLKCSEFRLFVFVLILHLSICLHLSASLSLTAPLWTCTPTWCTASLYQEWGHATETSTSWSSGRTPRESTAAWSTRCVCVTWFIITLMVKCMQLCLNHNKPSLRLSPVFLSLSLQNVPGVVECLKIITKTKSLRIADYAFRTARATGRRRVTAVHKANIMSVSDPSKGPACLFIYLSHSP